MAKIDDLKKEFPGLDVNLLELIYNSDPSKTHKYVSFLIRLIKGNLGKITPETILQKITGIYPIEPINLLIKFDEHLTAGRIRNTDISTYKGINDVVEAIKMAEESLKIKKLEKQVIKFLDDDSWVVLIPTTLESTQSYGANTKWCITNETSYRTYKKTHRIIIAINKKRNEKFAISKQFSNGAIEGWPASDIQTNPMLFPIPEYVFVVILKNIREGKNEIKIPELGGNSIYDNMGDIIPIETATVDQLKDFLKNFSDDFDKEILNAVKAKINGHKIDSQKVTPVTPKNQKLDIETLKQKIEERRNNASPANSNLARFFSNIGGGANR